MGLFSKKSSMKFKEIPSTPEQDAARSYLSGLYQQNLSFPQLDVPGLTDTEQDIQGRVGDLVSTSGQDFDAARGFLSGVIAGEYDPIYSQRYSILRDQLDQQKGDAQAQVRRTAQRAGSSRSTPFLGIEARTGLEYDRQKDAALNDALLAGLNLQMGATQGLANLRGSELQQLGQAGQIAGVEREVELQQQMAVYDKLIKDMIAPYEYSAKIAMSLLNEQRYAGYQTGGGLTDLGFGLNVASNMFSFTKEV